jgi:hypothetical protein
MGWEGLYYTLLPPLRPRIFVQNSVLYKFSPQKEIFCATPVAPYKFFGEGVPKLAKERGQNPVDPGPEKEGA